MNLLSWFAVICGIYVFRNLILFVFLAFPLRLFVKKISETNRKRTMEDGIEDVRDDEKSVKTITPPIHIGLLSFRN